ncbi:MAG: hypothetical protein DRN66_01485 [Candidatus Nanohalarchaeota archaeon]|nr:MAG: hypothetical protein DRN66_01485 [Candidatus Nanohaloarchaeota archaeon]
MKEIGLNDNEREALKVLYELTEQEFFVICYLSKYGVKTINELINDELAIQKERIYKILADLTEKGFIRSISEEKTKEFIVCDPKMMFSMLRENKKEDLNETGKSIEEKLASYVESPVFYKLGYDIVGSKKVRNINYNSWIEAKEFIYDLSDKSGFSVPKEEVRFLTIGKLKIKEGVEIRIMNPFEEKNHNFAKKMIEAGFKVRHIDEKYCTTVRRCITEKKTMIFLFPPEGREGKQDQVFVSYNKEFIEQTRWYYEMLWDIKAEDIKNLEL